MALYMRMKKMLEIDIGKTGLSTEIKCNGQVISRAKEITIHTSEDKLTTANVTFYVGDNCRAKISELKVLYEIVDKEQAKKELRELLEYLETNEK